MTVEVAALLRDDLSLHRHLRSCGMTEYRPYRPRLSFDSQTMSSSVYDSTSGPVLQSR